MVSAGGGVGWMMKTSRPRTFSLMRTKISPSAKRRMVTSASGICEGVGDLRRQRPIGRAGEQHQRSPRATGKRIRHASARVQVAIDSHGR